ncbi:mercuric ion binding protein [Tistlia consotensis]|uniref:Mercuric ion binding protein n=1 Tax=Tistlia consotensis USBA 355 TaxID=560819 RepID=A0A1Y6BSS6_9PROT|nr:cation transporter [Tistlia consotensis]SMF26514.1 mercuric ion binding protein [Tistlia consotensis USBA 355]SNR67061.1 mercuric ion binding protein [Tistlia consotensis]
MKQFLAALAGALALSTAAMAAERTVTLTVENMTCASCPYIVKKSMEAVPGVAQVAVSYETKTATVTFDDAKTSVDAIAGASASNGYPAKPVKQGG